MNTILKTIFLPAIIVAALLATPLVAMAGSAGGQSGATDHFQKVANYAACYVGDEWKRYPKLIGFYDEATCQRDHGPDAVYEDRSPGNIHMPTAAATGRSGGSKVEKPHFTVPYGGEHIPDIGTPVNNAAYAIGLTGAMFNTPRQ
jgi:hypothetical protein